MKTLVAIKRVVDSNIKVNIKPGGEALDLEGLKTTVNPFDENALEEAIRLRETGQVSEILAVSIGSKASIEILRHALAMGADRALLLETEEVIQPLSAAKLLRKLVEKENPDLILLGKQAIDNDAGQTGQMLAGLLGYSQATYISSLNIENGGVQVTREIDGGTEKLSLSLPALLTTDLRLNEPRFIKLPNLMKARKKPVEVLNADEFGIDITPKLKTLYFSEPPKRKTSIAVNNVEELLEHLRKDEGITI